MAEFACISKEGARCGPIHLRKYTLGIGRKQFYDLRSGVGCQACDDRGRASNRSAKFGECRSQGRDDALTDLTIIKNERAVFPTLLSRVISHRFRLRCVRRINVVHPLIVKGVKLATGNDCKT